MQNPLCWDSFLQAGMKKFAANFGAASSLVFVPSVG